MTRGTGYKWGFIDRRVLDRRVPSELLGRECTKELVSFELQRLLCTCGTQK